MKNNLNHLNEDQVAEMKQKQANYPEWASKKTVDATTPFSYLVKIASAQIKLENRKAIADAKEKAKAEDRELKPEELPETINASFSYIAVLFDENREELKRLLTDFGFNVEALPNEII